MMIEQDNVFDLPNMITFFLDYTYAAARPTTLDDPNGLGPIPGFGKFKIDKSCTKKICSQFYPLDEDVEKPVRGPAPPLSKPLAPGGSISVDGVYWPGAILKIPNNCNATLVCDKKGVAHFEFNCITWPFKDKPQKFINGTPPPPPPGWPPFL